MFCRVCAVTFGIVGATALVVLIRELPGAVRELRCIRMAKWQHQ